MTTTATVITNYLVLGDNLNGQSATTGTNITASTYRQMLTVLNDLVGHTHQWTDTYNTNCQCDCGRGNL
jgi:hypothetical protein